MDTKIKEPELVLDGIETAAVENEVAVSQSQELISDDDFTPEELAKIDAFSKKINLHDTNLVMQYGASSQKKLSDFSDATLKNVRSKDMGEIGKVLAELVTDVKAVGREDKGVKGFLNRKVSKIDALKARYEKSEVSVNRIAEELEKHQAALIKDVAMLDRLYDENKVYFKELGMYIAAGEKKLAEVREGELAELRAKAAETKDPQDAQEADDLAHKCERFEKKLYDLKLSRNICLQNAPQIRMVQNSDIQMSEKIQSTLVNTLPLWQSQMVLGLGIAHSKEAAEAQHLVSEATNDMLKKNAETLHMATTESARESERGIVDIETLQQTNQTLIDTIDEVIRIQEEGHAKRLEAEKELVRIENELKTKLLEASAGQTTVQQG